MIVEYDQLAVLLGSYFHQDWDLDAESWQGVVHNYISDSDAEDIQYLCAQLENFIEEFESGACDASIFLKLHCYYDYRPSGLSAVEWLSGILRILRES